MTFSTASSSYNTLQEVKQNTTMHCSEVSTVICDAITHATCITYNMAPVILTHCDPGLSITSSVQLVVMWLLARR